MNKEQWVAIGVIVFGMGIGLPLLVYWWLMVWEWLDNYKVRRSASDAYWDRQKAISDKRFEDMLKESEPKKNKPGG